jgi:hypothetical protein
LSFVMIPRGLKPRANADTRGQHADGARVNIATSRDLF